MRGWRLRPLRLVALGLLCWGAQDASTGAIRGTVEDPSGTRIVGRANGRHQRSQGPRPPHPLRRQRHFRRAAALPGDYTVRVASAGMQTELQHGIRVEIGSSTQVAFQMTVVGKTGTITVQCNAHEVDSEGVSSLKDRPPGLGRNALVGPDSSTTDSRFSRNFRVTNNLPLSLLMKRLICSII